MWVGVVEFERGVVLVVTTIFAFRTFHANELQFPFTSTELLRLIGLVFIVGVGILASTGAKSSLTAFQRLMTC
jgi:hypothetical protein